MNTSSTSNIRAHHPEKPDTDAFLWVPILALSAAGFLALTVELSPAGLLTRIAPDLHAGVAETGLLTALYSLGNALLVLPLARLASGYSRRWGLSVTLLVFVLGNLLVAFAGSLAPALIGRFIAGGAHGLLMALAPAVAVQMAGPRHAGRALVLVTGGNTLGIALGAPLASFVGTTMGWRVAFWGAAAVAFVFAVMLAATIPRMRSERGKSLSVMETARLPGVMRLGCSWMLAMLAYMAALTYIDPYLLQLGVSPLMVSLSLFVFGCASTLGVIIAGRVIPKSLSATLIAMPVTMGIAYIGLVLRLSSMPAVLFAIVLWGVGFAGLVLAYQRALLLVGNKAPETTMGIGVLLTQLGMAAGAFIGGIAMERFGVTAPAWVGIVFIAAALALLKGVNKALHSAGNEQNATGVSNAGADAT